MSQPPKTVIISGINGQLGQFMAKYLHETQPDIRVIGTWRHKSYDKQPYIFDSSKVTFELMDLSDPYSIEALVIKYKPDYFINTAANAFVGESWQVPAQHFQINALGVLYQLEAIRKFSPETRYFNMGTSEEFGATEESLLNEQSLLSPKSPYGSSKCAARFIVKVWRESYNLYALQGWTFNFESEIRGEKYVTRKITKGVARIAKAISEGKPFEPVELGNLDSFRSWQYAEDVADGIWRTLNQDEYNPQFKAVFDDDFTRKHLTVADLDLKEYVLSAPDVHTVREFVSKSFKVAGIDGEWRGSGPDEVYWHVHTPEAPSRWEGAVVRLNPKFLRPNDVTYLHGDASAISRELGWKPKVSFDELVKRMVESDLAAS